MIVTKHTKLQNLKIAELDLLKTMTYEFETDLTNLVRSGYGLNRPICTREFIDQWFSELQRHGDKSVTLIYDNATMIGYVSWDIDSNELNNCVDIEEVYVARGYRRKGAAYKAISDVMSYVKDHYGISLVSLEVYTANVAARKLYEKLGFQSQPLKYTLFKK